MVEKIVEENVAPIFKKFYIKCYGSFHIPVGIINYHQLESGDALRCCISELLKGGLVSKKNLEILVTVHTVDTLMDRSIGQFSEIDYESYNLDQYDYALLNIISIIKRYQ